ncbi:MAG: GAF domain-containing protein [Actinobacteria bacterium]|nr:GAF domain-containing protein [Actinomycetota bacterium]
MAQLPERDREALERIAAAQEADTIDRALTAARERLQMDAAYVTSIDSETQVVNEVAGDSAAMGFGPGTVARTEDSYCSRMLSGALPNVVPDTSREPAVRDLGATSLIGSYVGVAITLADGSLHGTLCCASSEPRDHLGDEELAFMRVLAGMVANRIDRSHADGPR